MSTSGFGAKPAILRCGRCGKFVDWQDARLQVVCGCRPILALATDPMWQRAGVGGHLVAEAELLARRQNWPRVIVTITNDNLPALYFYQRRGYRMSAILRDSIAAHTREAKAVGFAGIPILDEIQLAKDV